MRNCEAKFLDNSFLLPEIGLLNQKQFDWYVSDMDNKLFY